MKHICFLVGFLICSILLLVSCSRQAVLAQGWSAPNKVTDSKDSLAGGVIPYKWHGSIIVLQGLGDKSAKCFLMSSDAGSWTEVQMTGVPRGYFWVYPAIDQSSDRVFFDQGYMENDQLVMNVLVGRMTGRIAVQEVVEKKWITDKTTLFGETSPGVRLNDPGTRDYPGLGLGLIDGRDLYVPYALSGKTLRGNPVAEYGEPFSNGAFHSIDSGTTWQLERISDFAAWLPSICKTKAYCYYLAVKNYQRDLWFSRKPAEVGSWASPEVVTKTFCNSALSWKYIATAENDTVHVCWLDRRHEKTRPYAVDPSGRHNCGNYEVAYCHRKDSDAGWSKDSILSAGLLYSFAPVMSVEGDKVVVAWAGVPDDKDGHDEFWPNDIYYVTSKDGGKTWTTPLRLTDNIKAGITAGRPQVALLNGIIHLFYSQGKISYREESHGLVKLNQPPWPIYYRQRPFPD